MRLGTSAILLLAFLTTDADAQKEVETLDNGSIENSKELRPITINRNFESLPEPNESVGLTFPDQRRPQTETGRRAKAAQQGPDGYRLIDIHGPKAPSVSTKYILKDGPVKKKRDTIRVVEFWATWCGSCKTTIPILTRTQSKYAAQNVQIIGISCEENVNVVRNYVNQRGNEMNYTVGFDPEWRTSEPYNAIWSVNTIPHAYLISHDNRILWQGNPANAAALDAAIAEAIQYRDGKN